MDHDVAAADLAARAAMARALAMWPYMTEARRADLDAKIAALEGLLDDDATASERQKIADDINDFLNNPLSNPKG